MCYDQSKYKYNLSHLPVSFDYGFNRNFPNNRFNKRDLENIPEKVPGYYVLGYNVDGFKFLYVGRSDDDLRQEITNQIRRKDLTHFVYKTVNKELDSFYMECIIYHDFENAKLLNEYHPKRPNNYEKKYPNLKCPLINCEELE